MPSKAAPRAPGSAEQQLKRFIAKFDPPHQALIRSVRRTLRKRLAGTNELVYDNYNFFVIGYCSTERPSDCIVSIAAGANGIGLSFPFNGSSLPDPHKLLSGSGSWNRFIRIPSPAMLDRPEVDALIAAAVAQNRTPLQPRSKGQLIIKSISAKQRPRRRTSK